MGIYYTWAVSSWFTFLACWAVDYTAENAGGLSTRHSTVVESQEAAWIRVKFVENIERARMPPTNYAMHFGHKLIITFPDVTNCLQTTRLGEMTNLINTACQMAKGLIKTSSSASLLVLGYPDTPPRFGQLLFRTLLLFD